MYTLLYKNPVKGKIEIEGNGREGIMPNFTVYHLPRLISDHCPVLFLSKDGMDSDSYKPFRFQHMWCKHPDFKAFVERNSFFYASPLWNLHI